MYPGFEAPKEEVQPPTSSAVAPKINTSGIRVEGENVTLRWSEEGNEQNEAYIVAFSPAVGSERWTYRVAQVSKMKRSYPLWHTEDVKIGPTLGMFVGAQITTMLIPFKEISKLSFTTVPIMPMKFERK